MEQSLGLEVYSLLTVGKHINVELFMSIQMFQKSTECRMTRAFSQIAGPSWDKGRLTGSRKQQYLIIFELIYVFPFFPSCLCLSYCSMPGVSNLVVLQSKTTESGVALRQGKTHWGSHLQLHKGKRVTLPQGHIPQSLSQFIKWGKVFSRRPMHLWKVFSRFKGPGGTFEDQG